MKKLRIQKMPYVNQGTANIKLKGVKEYHAIFKFDTDKEAEDFINQVREFWYSINEIKPVLLQGGISTKDAAKALADTMNRFKKDEPKTQTVKKPAKKKPGPKKGTGGRPKSNL